MPAELEDVLVEWTELPETIEASAGESIDIWKSAGASVDVTKAAGEFQPDE